MSVSAQIMRKAKSLATNGLRLGGIVVFDICMNGTNISNFIWFLIGCLLVIWLTPWVITKILFTNESYDGTFLIDENDPTDVKFKLTFDTDPALIANMNDILIKVDHREGNMDTNGGDENEE